MAKNVFKVDFSIDGLSLVQQDKIFKKIVNMLDYNQRQDLHVTVTDSIGGQHFIWNGGGIDPNGIKCSKCSNIECYTCPVYIHREAKRNE